MQNQDGEVRQNTKEKKRSFRPLFLLIVVGALLPLAYVGWKDLYRRFLESTPPTINIIEFPRGVGLSPVAMRLSLVDEGAGLDEVVVRTVQKTVSREILRQNLNGARSAPVTLEFPGERSNLDEGAAYIEVKVFDRSLWSSMAQKTMELRVDYRRPRVEVLSTQHNARHGGSQLVFYRAFDEELGISGVRVGSQNYIGYPARGLDRTFEDDSIYVALYTADFRNAQTDVPVRVFAEDQVGNGHSVSFYNKIQKRDMRRINLDVDDEFLRDHVSLLADQNFQKLKDMAEKSGEELNYSSDKAGFERLMEKFKLVNERLRQLNDREVASLLSGPSYEAFWRTAFSMPGMRAEATFGDLVTYKYDGKEIGKATMSGFEFGMSQNEEGVFSAHDGLVAFSDNLGTYGRVVAIDHGLGLISLYGHLEQVLVHKGDEIKRGQRIGVAGTSGLSRRKNFLFEMRVSGVPVDPREWWDEGWFYAHVLSKTEEVKKLLGMPVYRGLGE